MLYGRECLFGKFKSSAWSCTFPTSCAHTPRCPPQFTGRTQSEKQKKSWHCASSAHQELNMSVLSALALVVNLEHRPTWAAMKKIKSILACTPLHTGRWNSVKKKKKLKIGGAFYVLCQLNSSFFKKPCMLRKGHPAVYFLVRYCWLFLSKSLLLRFPNFFQQIVSNNFFTGKWIYIGWLLILFLSWMFHGIIFALKVWA